MARIQNARSGITISVNNRGYIVYILFRHLQKILILELIKFSNQTSVPHLTNQMYRISSVSLFFCFNLVQYN